MTDTISNLKHQTKAYEKTSKQLSETVANQINFSESVKKLMKRLEEIDKIKDINNIFWNETKQQLNEGVNIIKQGSNRLQKDVEAINEEFYDRLNSTFTSLDTLISRVIEKHRNSN